MIEHEVKTTRTVYIKDLADLQQLVISMGEAAVQALSKATESFFSYNCKMAQEVIDGDDVIDDFEVEIEERCLVLTAKQQPIAHDLRVISTAFKISTDLERIGDNAYDIAKATCDLIGPPDLETKYTPELAKYALEMLKEAIEAYRNGDVELAEKIRQQDALTDELFGNTFMKLSAFVTTSVEQAKQATEILFMARFLERIADHATNIAESVIFLETAERVK